MEENIKENANESYSFQVDLRGMIRLLSENLYSSSDVFLRELLQNSVDALEARKAVEEDFRDGKIEIHYHTNPDGSAVLTFSENGIGLTCQEIHTFLSVIGQSSKRGETRRSGFIGQFGIGLLSCFLVTDEILVQSRSVREEQSWQWLGRSDGTYQVTEGERLPEPGTKVTIRLSKGMAERYNEKWVTELLQKYGFMLRIPVTFRGDEECVQINDNLIPWRQSFCSGEEIMRFGEWLFQEEFMGVVPILGEGLKGYAYISLRQVSAASAVSHKIYLKDMLVTEEGKELIPKWAFFTRCVINAEDLTPMASREGFVSDQKLAKARNAIERCLFDYFVTLSECDTKKLRQITAVHNLAIKSLAVENEKIFRLFFPFLVFHTNQGNLIGREIVKAAAKFPVYYCVEVDDYRRARPLVGGARLLVNAGYTYEAKLMHLLKRANPDLRVEVFDETSYGELLEEPSEYVRDEFEVILPVAEHALAPFRCGVALKQFEPAEMPALYVGGNLGFFDLGEEEESGFLDGFSSDFLGGGYAAKLYLNVKNPMVRRLGAVRDEKMAETMIRVLFAQTKLSEHYELHEQEKEMLNRELISLMEYGLGRSL